MANSKNNKPPIGRRAQRPTSIASKSGRSPIDRMGSTALFSRDDEVFRQGQGVSDIYRVEFGCVRTYTNLSDGRRLVGAFYFPGDYFGFEMRKQHHVSAEAVTASMLRVIPIKGLASRAASDAAVAMHLLHVTNVELQRAQSHGLLLRVAADNRVANFLFDMKKRNRRKEVELLMSRQDIADHLNLTIETVSRALTQLQKQSAITVLSERRIAVNFRKRLAA